MRQGGCPETSVTNYQSTLCNIPEERASHLHRSGNLESRAFIWFWYQLCSSFLVVISVVSENSAAFRRRSLWMLFLLTCPLLLKTWRDPCLSCVSLWRSGKDQMSSFVATFLVVWAQIVCCRLPHRILLRPTGSDWRRCSD